MDFERIKRIKERSKRFGIPKTQRLLLIHNDNK
nr:MAG TPA: Tho1/MOS11 C-terminal domain [Caudoviricetes sp.]